MVHLVNASSNRLHDVCSCIKPIPPETSPPNTPSIAPTSQAPFIDCSNGCGVCAAAVILALLCCQEDLKATSLDSKCTNQCKPRCTNDSMTIIWVVHHIQTNLPKLQSVLFANPFSWCSFHSCFLVLLCRTASFVRTAERPVLVDLQALLGQSVACPDPSEDAPDVAHAPVLDSWNTRGRREEEEVREEEEERELLKSETRP